MERLSLDNKLLKPMKEKLEKMKKDVPAVFLAMKKRRRLGMQNCLRR